MLKIEREINPKQKALQFKTSFFIESPALPIKNLTKLCMQKLV